MVSLRPPAAVPVVGVVADGRTCRHLLYLLVALPIFVHSDVFSFGVALAPVLVGLVVLFATLIVARPLAAFGRRLADALGTDLATPADLDEADGAVATATAYVDAASTWRGLGFLPTKPWVGLFGLVPLFLLARGLPLVAAPARYPVTAQFRAVNGEPATWAIETLPEALAAVPLGVAAILVACHLGSAVGYAARRMAVALVAGPRRDGSAGESERVAVDGGATGE